VATTHLKIHGIGARSVDDGLWSRRSDKGEREREAKTKGSHVTKKKKRGLGSRGALHDVSGVLRVLPSP
jgi:hypothetical protein